MGSGKVLGRSGRLCQHHLRRRFVQQDESAPLEIEVLQTRRLLKDMAYCVFPIRLGPSTTRNLRLSRGMARSSIDRCTGWIFLYGRRTAAKAASFSAIVLRSSRAISSLRRRSRFGRCCVNLLPQRVNSCRADPRRSYQPGHGSESSWRARGNQRTAPSWRMTKAASSSDSSYGRKSAIGCCAASP